MKKYPEEELILFLDVILTGEEFAEYTAEEREAMFRQIRTIVAEGRDRDAVDMRNLKRMLWLVVRMMESHVVWIPYEQIVALDEKTMVIETWEDVVNGKMMVRAGVVPDKKPKAEPS
ncbi:MAG: hypothetical protein M0R66_10375 [Candidatus Omnitrophica bacterium]|jgi:hypothetical protein|nr:hypothetical protein [Candidatus Omnitrophota bacterium]